MDLNHFEEKLRAKELELNDAISRLESNARESDNTEVRDPLDDAAASEGVSEALGESSTLSRMLDQVEAALGRIKDGTFGHCLDCDREIEPARLEAIPWAEYCIADQERREREENAPQGTTL